MGIMQLAFPINTHQTANQMPIRKALAYQMHAVYTSTPANLPDSF